jgi:RNA repair, ligase-Pnkp-associating, region of Hen1
LRRLFEPLGYEVTPAGHPLDEKFPEWGDSRSALAKMMTDFEINSLRTGL